MKKLVLTAMVLGLGLVGCKKKAATEGAGSGSDTGSAGSAMATGSGSGSGAGSATGSGSAAMAGSGSGSGSAEGSAPKTGAALADAYKACAALLNAAKFDDFKAQCADGSWVGHDMGKDLKLDDAMAFFASMHTAFPDWKVEPQVILVSGKTVIAAVLETGTQSGVLKLPGMPDVPPTNKKVGLMMLHRMVFNDAGKAVEEWPFADPGTMMAQLGLAPKDMPAKRPAMDKGLDGAPIVVVAADDDKEKKNLEVVKQGNAAFDAHKYADMMAVWADDAVESDQASAKDATGKKDIEAGAKMFLDAFSDGKMTKSESWAAGDFVATIGTFTGTNDHDMGKMKKTGKQVAVPVAELAQLKDGKIAKVWRFYSSLDFAMQMGLVPMPGAGSAAGAGSGAGSGSAAAGSGSGSAAPAKP